MAGVRGTVLSLQFSANIFQELISSYISYRDIYIKKKNQSALRKYFLSADNALAVPDICD